MEAKHMQEITRFLAARTVEERDRVIAAERWGGIYAPGPHPWDETPCPACLVDNAIGYLGAYGLHAVASHHYETACRELGLAETVRCVKEIAARLNGSDASAIQAMLTNSAPANV